MTKHSNLFASHVVFHLLHTDILRPPETLTSQMHTIMTLKRLLPAPRPPPPANMHPLIPINSRHYQTYDHRLPLP